MASNEENIAMTEENIILVPHSQDVDTWEGSSPETELQRAYDAADARSKRLRTEISRAKRGIEELKEVKKDTEDALDVEWIKIKLETELGFLRKYVVLQNKEQRLYEEERRARTRRARRLNRTIGLRYTSLQLASLITE